MSVKLGLRSVIAQNVGEIHLVTVEKSVISRPYVAKVDLRVSHNKCWWIPPQEVRNDLARLAIALQACTYNFVSRNEEKSMEYWTLQDTHQSGLANFSNPNPPLPRLTGSWLFL